MALATLANSFRVRTRVHDPVEGFPRIPCEYANAYVVERAGTTLTDIAEQQVEAGWYVTRDDNSQFYDHWSGEHFNETFERV